MGKELKVCKNISAKEARELSDSSNFTLRHIYRMIRECATKNMRRTNWYVGELSEVALSKAMAQLKEDGFEIKLEEKDACLSIAW